MQSSIDFICSFLRQEVFNRGFKRVVVGLSGGVDSAVVAKLCQESFQENLSVLLLPSSTSNPTNLNDAKAFAQTHKIAHHIIPIAPFESAFQELSKLMYPSSLKEKIRIGNFCARIRMNLLYDYAFANNALVIGTSNKSELMLGYGTIYGDLAYAINPIGDLYKTQVYSLAYTLEIPHAIISKKPSADLFENQSDEEDIGFDYREIDRFLRSLEKIASQRNITLFSLALSDFKQLAILKEALQIEGFRQEIIDSLLTRIIKNNFKRELPTVLKF